MKQKSLKCNKTEPLSSGFENLWPSVHWIIDEPEECKICRYGVDIMWSHLRSGVNHEIQTLNKFCETQDIQDPEKCLLGIETWWPTLSQIIYSPQTVPYVCNHLNNGCDVFK